MARLAIFGASIVVALAAPGAASAQLVAFKTPGGAAYCEMHDTFVCFRPRDGFYVRFVRLFGDADLRIGYDAKYRGFRRANVRVLPVGRVWYSSDAAVITCVSGKSALTCRHYEGLSFSVGRSRGYRIFYAKPGFRSNVRAFFRTAFGVYCGLNRHTLEPAAPGLVCWRAADGVRLSLSHQSGSRGGHDRNERDAGYRPSGFPLLPDGGRFAWRCRIFDEEFATRCSARSGTAIFTCENRRGRLTCRNRHGHGFFVSRSSFYAF